MSEEAEKEANTVMKELPGIGPLYSGSRAAAYQARGDDKEAQQSGIDMARGTLHTAALFACVPSALFVSISLLANHSPSGGPGAKVAKDVIENVEAGLDKLEPK